MRWWACLGLLGVACSSQNTLGAYRIPMRTSDTDVAIKTMLVYTDGAEMVLFDAKDGREFGRGQGQIYSEVTVNPFRFKVPQGHPLALVVNEGVLEDRTTHPYRRVPIPPLDSKADSVRRVTLSSAGVDRELVISGGNIFAETSEAQPPETELPGPLFALNSVAGTGLWLPAQAETLATWRDAVTSLAPPDPSRNDFCAVSLVSTIRARSNVEVEVPEGKFRALQVTEIIDTCQLTNAPELTVLSIDRWYVRGVGPVKMTYQAGDGLVREYNLVSHQVTGAADAAWPLEAGNRWSYEVRGPDNTVVGTPVEVSVSAVKDVALPAEK